MLTSQPMKHTLAPNMSTHSTTYGYCRTVHDVHRPFAVVQVPNVQRDRVYSESQYEQNDDDEKEARDVVPGALEEGGNNTGVTAGGENRKIGSSIGITEGENDKDYYDERKKKQRAELKQWFAEKVKLTQYYVVFVDNGYESLDIVMEITTEDELKEIGITLKGHVLKLMKEIRRLNSSTVN
eukprot:67753_1